MPFPYHTIELQDGSNPNLSDRLVSGLQLAVANAAGSAGGAAVTTAVSFASPLPPNYLVSVDAGQPSVLATVSEKTSSGFNVVLQPLSTATTVAAGTFNCIVFG
jgi:hypothetical protein